MLDHLWEAGVKPKRYVLIEVYSTDEFAMPCEQGDPRARLNIAALREIAQADVVLAIGPDGGAVVVKDGDEEARPEDAIITMVHARPENWA